MKNILIVGYYYYPYNIVASHRIVAFAEYLSQNNNVTVMTRSWSGTEKGIQDIFAETSTYSDQKITPTLRVIGIPYKRSEKQHSFPRIAEKYNYYFGEFADAPAIEANYWHQLDSYLQQNKVDCILYSCNPYQFIPIAKKLFDTYRIPFFIDFRDYINSDFLKKKISFKQQVYKFIIGQRLKRLLVNAAGLITVSNPIKKQLEKIYNGPVEVVYNGFNDKLSKDLYPVKENTREFQIAYTGNISEAMDVSTFMDGLRMFFNKKRPKAKLLLIGLADEARKRFTRYEHDVDIEFLNWMPHVDVLKIARSSSLLVYMGWAGYSGVLSGKIFDYLGVERKILLVPGDKDVIEELLESTAAGDVANSAEEVYAILVSLYEEWEKNGHIAYSPKREIVNHYSRREQTLKVEQLLTRVIDAT